ncbi:MAG: type II toxin-antitoxin system CcdA family antitoxin [Kiloniellaceae bacterium]
MAPPVFYRLDAPKRPTNVSLNEDLVRAAKSYGINVSSVAEAALAQAVRERTRQAWIEENSEAIEQYNDRVKSRGVFGDGLRRF